MSKPKMHVWSRRAALAVAVSGGYASLGTPALAETYTWTRGAGTNNWSVDGNWQNSLGANVRPPSEPPAGDVTDLVFAGAYGAGTTSTQNLGTITVNSITFGSFTSNNGTLTISGSTSGGPPVIFLGAGGIVGNGSGTVSFPNGTDRKIVLTADQTWSNSNLTGIISQRRPQEGAFKITKTGPGTIEFQGNNVLWTGGLDIQEGFIRLSASNNAIGVGTVTSNTSNNVGVTASGTDPLDQLITGPMVLGGTGSFSFGGSWSFNVNGGLTLLSDKNVVVSQNVTVEDPIAGNFRFIKLGGGTLATAATNNNAGFDVRAGTMLVGADAQLGAAGSDVGLGSSMTSQGTIQLGTLRATAPFSSTRNVNILDANGGRIDTNGNAVAFGNVAGPGAFAKLGDGQLTVNHVRATDFAVSGGSVRIAPGVTAGEPARVSVVTSLTLNDGAVPTPAPTTLDLTNNGIVVDYTGASPLADVQAAIVAAYNNGAWDQPGLTSSSANNTTHGVGYAEAGDLFSAFPAPFMGQQVDDTAVLARYTRYGDANLDGAVNLQDFNRLAANFGSASAGWDDGDFNYDGSVNLSDFNRLAANFGLQASANGPTPGDWAALGAAVPEPSGLALIGLSGSTLVRRRRRH